MLMTRKLGPLVIPVLAAVAFQAFVAGESALAAADSTTKPAAKPAGRATLSKTPITFSITSSIRRGTLVVSLDNVPVFNEEFQKPALLISQTTTWDPVQVSAGKHRLRAKVVGQNGKTYHSAAFDLEVSRTKGIELRFKTTSSGLTVEPKS